MTMFGNIKVGDILCFAERRQYGTKEWQFAYLPVAKVGHKWITLQRSKWSAVRANITTGNIESEYGSIGRIYLTRADFDREQRDDAAWTALIEKLKQNIGAWPGRPRDLDAATIERAAALLGITLLAAPDA